jgi:hypothetical protein
VNRSHARIVPERDRRRVSLTTDGLHRLKVPKRDHIQALVLLGNRAGTRCEATMRCVEPSLN